MSAALDYDAGDPFYTTSVGPQSDGTYGIPIAGQAVTPYDAGGGPNANYSAQVLDLFKFGVGVWQSESNQNRMTDYRRFEATQNGLIMQGQAAAGVVTAQTTARSNSQMLMMLMFAAGAYVVLK